MIIVTKEEFFNFIKSQPDERELDFSSNVSNDDSCGCPMLHYAKENFNEPIYFALVSSWISGITEGRYIVHARFAPDEIDLNSFRCNATNYGQLKYVLSVRYPSFNWN